MRRKIPPPLSDLTLKVTKERCELQSAPDPLACVASARSRRAADVETIRKKKKKKSPTEKDEHREGRLQWGRVKKSTRNDKQSAQETTVSPEVIKVSQLEGGGAEWGVSGHFRCCIAS